LTLNYTLNKPKKKFLFQKTTYFCNQIKYNFTPKKAVPTLIELGEKPDTPTFTGSYTKKFMEDAQNYIS